MVADSGSMGEMYDPPPRVVLTTAVLRGCVGHAAVGIADMVADSGSMTPLLVGNQADAAAAADMLPDIGSTGAMYDLDANRWPGGGTAASAGTCMGATQDLT